MKTRDWVIIGIGVLAAWYFAQDAGAAPSISILNGGGSSGSSGSSSGSRPASGQIMTPQAADVSHARDVITTATLPATGTAPATVTAASALHTPALGQRGWDTRVGRAVFFNGSNWDFGTYSGKFDPNAPDATADNAYIESGAGTTWYQKNENLPTYP